MLTSTRRPPTASERRRPPWYVIVLRVLAVLVALGALGVFSYYAARLTLSPVNDRGQAGGNVDPGHSLRFYLDQPTWDAARQIGGNMVLLAPLGVLLPIVSTRLRGPLRLALVGAMASLAIETVQGTVVLGRAFDVDDIILNTAGVVLAYLLVGRKLSHLLRGRPQPDGSGTSRKTLSSRSTRSA
ncbi:MULTISPECIES: VanZ family protein [Thermomonospora]|uniref:Glycopeptide antibiotics resistance protein n=1 Tax=Thermomonospora cellulosilytica TaxID=1411118 RepID=A0A7W3MZF4_9ACTN|nr:MULTISPECIES: VanZ family protein [Thermomonospora]MBA9004704.1 glycopeptide antibiotics resistance protein [Thermomonospora cellulosilytica]